MQVGVPHRHASRRVAEELGDHVEADTLLGEGASKVDVSFDLSKEYEMALNLSGGNGRHSP